MQGVQAEVTAHPNFSKALKVKLAARILLRWAPDFTCFFSLYVLFIFLLAHQFLKGYLKIFICHIARGRSQIMIFQNKI